MKSDKDCFSLWSITNLSAIVMQECRNVLWLIVENDALVMAARDWSLKFMTNHKTSKVNHKKKCLEIPGPHNTQWLIAKNSQVNKQWGIN